MKFLARTIIVLCIINLTAAGSASAMMTASKDKTLTVSGSTGVPGVRMKGLPGDVVTDQNGYYSATVPRGFTGTIVPLKEGYTFTPASRIYSNVTSDQDSQNHVPEMLTFTISGNAGVSGATMQGLPGNVVTDQRGFYAVKLPYGWSGIVKPVRSSYRFRPAALNFTKIMVDQNGSDFLAMPEPADAGGTDPYAGFVSPQSRGRGTGYGRAIRSGGRKALIIPARAVEANELAQTVEDMRVMSHILDERFKETRRVQGMFTDLGSFFGRDNRSTEATYLQGFGVLFLMEVNFAFSPPPRKQTQQPAETAEASDSTWEKARQRVLTPGAAPRAGGEESARDRDKQMVEELKRELVEALRHASNIRNVDSAEWVILTVIGGQRQFGTSFGGGMGMGGGMSEFGSPPRSSGSPGAGGGMGGGYGGGGGGYAVGGYGSVGGMMSGGMGGMYGGMSTYGAATSSASTVLTIRAKKADVDEFAKGQSDLEQFQQHVQIFTY